MNSNVRITDNWPNAVTPCPNVSSGASEALHTAPQVTMIAPEVNQLLQKFFKKINLAYSEGGREWTTPEVIPERAAAIGPFPLRHLYLGANSPGLSAGGRSRPAATGFVKPLNGWCYAVMARRWNPIAAAPLSHCYLWLP
jgi:hypothetical protein